VTSTTTIRVSTETHAEVKALADADGVAVDVVIKRLARRERQRRMGLELAGWEPSAEDTAWLEMKLPDDTARR
jgi:hypothetical protein